MNKLPLVLAMPLLLTGCETLEAWQKIEEAKLAAQNAPKVELETTKEPEHLTFQSRYRDKLFANKGKTFKGQDVNYYVRGMMQQLVGNLQYVTSKTPMAVTSFVFLDGSYEHSDVVGKQLSESFVHEVHKYGIPVVDFKATDYIRVTQHGDFVLSKDFLDLDADLPIKYVLTGTLVKQPSGYLVNARIVGVKSKAVVATAQGKLPNSVINSLISSEEETGLLLMSKGE